MSITVKELLSACRKQVDKGNGDKVVLITSDDEGNAYHTLFCMFTDDIEDIKGASGLFQDSNNPEDVVLLG